MQLASTTWLLVLTSLLLSTGCGDDPSAPTLPDDGLPDACHPLRASGICASPYPATFYTRQDDSSATGVRLNLTADHFPTSLDGVRFEPTALNRRDGFSPSTHLMVVLDERLDPSALPTLDAPEASLDASSATVIVDADTGERVAHFAELDAQVVGDEGPQALILRPIARLDFGRRYVAAVTRKMRTASGGDVASPIGWASHAGADVLATLADAGVTEDDVVVAWDFVTASRDNSTADLSAMVSSTLSTLPEEGLGYTVTSVDEDFSTTTLRRIHGTFTVPRFVSHSDLARTDITLLRSDGRSDDGSDEGTPVSDGTYEAPFVMLVPRSATVAAPARLLIYGHGFINTAEGAFGEADNERFPQRFGDGYDYAFIGTNWWGLSTDDTANNGLQTAISDLNKLEWISARLKQSVVNNVVLARTAKSIAADSAVTGTDAAIDASRVDYLGISLGGIMGSVLLGYSPDLARAVLHVGAASWSTLLQRSKLWGLFRIFVDQAYAAPLDHLQLIAAFQLEMDETEGLTRADELTESGRVLLQMGLHDDAVSNVATAVLARSMGLSMLDDSPVTIPFITATTGPLESGLTVFDTGQEPPPKTNVANPTTDPNDAHEIVRDAVAVQEQMHTFLSTGDIVSTCEDTCDPN